MYPLKKDLLSWKVKSVLLRYSTNNKYKNSIKNTRIVLRNIKMLQDMVLLQELLAGKKVIGKY